MPFFAASEAPPRPESMKFPVFSLLAGNLAFSETSSQLTPPSSGESIANLTFGGASRSMIVGGGSADRRHRDREEARRERSRETRCDQQFQPRRRASGKVQRAQPSERSTVSRSAAESLIATGRCRPSPVLLRCTARGETPASSAWAISRARNSPMTLLQKRDHIGVLKLPKFRVMRSHGE